MHLKLQFSISGTLLKTQIVKMHNCREMPIILDSKINADAHYCKTFHIFSIRIAISGACLKLCNADCADAIPDAKSHKFQTDLIRIAKISTRLLNHVGWQSRRRDCVGNRSSRAHLATAMLTAANLWAYLAKLEKFA